MLENSLLKIIVFIACALFIFVFIIAAFIWDKKTDEGGSDERQKIVNGQCATVSFLTMICINAVSYLATKNFNFKVDLTVMFLCSILLGGLSYTLYGIWKDSIFTRVWTPKKWIMVLVLWILFICYAALGYVRKGIIDNLILSITGTVILFVVMINLAIKHLLDKKQEE